MNSTDTETVADVLAEIRDAATSADAWRAGMAANVVMDYADRVEIAVRRELDHAVEHATRHAEAVARDNCRDCIHNPNGHNYDGGNAAAVREAIVKIRDKCVIYNNDLAEEIDALCGNALSAPPRNCDRFADAEAARQAWLDDAENWDEFGSPRLELHEWLFAPVAERKGEGDGR